MTLPARTISVMGTILRGSEVGDDYAVNGFSPELVFDAVSDFYRVGGSTAAASDVLSVANGSTVAPMYVNSSGVVTAQANNTLRKDHHIYNPVSGEFERAGCLIEDFDTTNLMRGSQGVSATYWQEINATRTALAADGPRGANTMTLFAETTATGLHGTSANNTKFDVVSGTTYTVSAYVKKFGARRYVQITMAAFGFTNTQYATFDLDTGTVSGSSGGTGRIERYSAEVYRIQFSVAANSTRADAGEPVIISSNAATGRVPSFAGSTSNGFYIDLPQVEVRAEASSPVLTTTATRTRTADTVTLASADIPFDAAGVSIAMSGRQIGDSHTLLDWTADANNQIQLRSLVSSFRTTQEALGVVDFVVGGSFTSSALGSAFSIASRHTASDVNLAVDGTALTANDTVSSMPALGSASATVMPDMSGVLGELVIWGANIADAGIAEAS